MTVALKNGQIHHFSGIEKKELELIMEYFSNRKIPVKTMSDPVNLLNNDEEDSDDVFFIIFL